MPLDPSSRSSRIAYVLKVNEVPMTGDLPSDTDALKKITIKKKE